jgi:hypothetical protein
MAQKKIDTNDINYRIDCALDNLLSEMLIEYNADYKQITQEQENKYTELVNNLTEHFKTCIEQSRDPEINFTLEDLRKYEGEEISICGYDFKLYLDLELSGECAIWSCKPYIIYATPGFEFISVPVDVRDNESDETIGDDEYNDPISTFDEYKLAVKIMAGKIIQQYETGNNN